MHHVRTPRQAPTTGAEPDGAGRAATLLTGGRRTGALLLLLSLFLASACAAPDPQAAGLEALESAAGAMGELSADRPALAFVAEGTLNKAAEGQGFRGDEASPGPLRERVAVHPGGQVAAVEYHERRFDGTFEWVGEVFGPGDSTLVVLPTLGIVIRSTDAEAAEGRTRVYRRLPHRLVREALARPDEVRLLDRDSSTPEGQVAVAAVLDGGTEVTLRIDGSSDLVRAVALEDDLEGRGPSEIVWRFDDYRDVGGGLRIPHRYSMSVDSLSYMDMTVIEVLEGDEARTAFQAPDTLRIIDVGGGPSDEGSTAESDGAEGDASGEEEQPALPPLEVESVAPGVYQVPGVRSGFDPLVVEFGDFLMAVDAPASFPLLNRIPPGHTDPAPKWTFHSRRFVEALETRFPDKPVRYLVLTHGHLDHVAGVPAFTDIGATVVGAPSVRLIVERVLESAGGSASSEGGPTGGQEGAGSGGGAGVLEWQSVSDTATISDGERAVRLLVLGENPHEAGMLVVYVEDQDLLFVSDLFTPARLEVYPRDSHAALDRFLAGWLRERGLAPDRILSMHGSGEITREHLERLR